MKITKSKQKGMEMETRAFNYLETIHGNHFIHAGKSDSTQPDIIAKNDNYSYGIEVKAPQARGGQFVIRFKNGNLKLSPYNKAWGENYSKTLTLISTEIMNLINPNDLRESKQKLNLSKYKSLMYSWIINHYQICNKYIITNTQEDGRGRFILFPVDKIPQYFTCQVNLRHKKSGSSPLGKTFENMDKIKAYLNKHHIFDNNFSFIKSNDKKRTYLVPKQNTKLEQNIYIPDITKSKDGFVNKVPNKKGLYEIRKLSNTSNLTLLFGIKLKIS